MTLILASGSAARRALLAGAGIAFSVAPADIDERAIEIPMIAGGASPADIASALAVEKALAVSRLEREATVIGADQTLDLDGERWTKPASIDAARSQLMRLAGRSHRLHSAVAVSRGDSVTWQHLSAASLQMRALSPAEIDAYLDLVGDRVLSSVGAYQIEGPGIRLFQSIDGDHSTILGLPLLPLLAYLRGEGELSW